jgi:hypothetical protein
MDTVVVLPFSVIFFIVEADINFLFYQVHVFNKYPKKWFWEITQLLTFVSDNKMLEVSVEFQSCAHGGERSNGGKFLCYTGKL